MRLFIFYFLFTFCSISYSQIKIDSNLLIPDSGGSLVSLQLDVYNFNVSKSKNKIYDVDSLYYTKYKKAKKPIFFFYFNPDENRVLYRNKYYTTNIGYIKNVLVSDETISFNFIVKGSNEYYVKISSKTSDEFNVVLVKNINRKKPKIFFSNNTNLSKKSF